MAPSWPIREETNHEDDQGARYFPRAVRRRRNTLQQPGRHRRLGRGPWLQGRAVTELGRASVRSRPRRRKHRLLRRGKGRAVGSRRAAHGTVHASAGPVDRRASGLRYRLRRLCGARGSRQPGRPPEMGGRAAAACRQGVAQSRPLGPRHLLRRPGLAVRLPLAAAARRPGGDRLRRTGAPLDADPECLRRGGCRRLLRDPSRARICTTASPTKCSWSA